MPQIVAMSSSARYTTLETILSRSTEDSFLAALKAGRQEKYSDWGLREISKQEAADKEKIEPKKFPFNLDGLLPWWNRMAEHKMAARRT